MYPGTPSNLQIIFVGADNKDIEFVGVRNFLAEAKESQINFFI
jgi:hypothetical protein